VPAGAGRVGLGEDDEMAVEIAVRLARSTSATAIIGCGRTEGTVSLVMTAG
jgi:hypothetical protein